MTEQEELRKLRMAEDAKNRSNRAYADLGASLGPSVLALLGGSSTNLINSQLQKGDKYAQSRGAQEALDSVKLSTVKNELGSPEYARTSDAEYMEPYMAKKGAGSSLADPSNIQKTQSVYDRATNSFKLVGITKAGNVIDLGLEPSLGVGTSISKDVYDTKVQEQYNKNDPSKKTPVKTTPGYGTLTGTPIQTQKDVNKITEKYVKDTDILETKKNELSNAISIFQNPNAGPTELTAAREALIRSITTETRLTDSDVERALGNDFRDVVSQVGSSLSNKAFAEMSDAQKKDFLSAANTLIKRLETGLNFAYNKSKQRASSLPGGKKSFESQTPERTKSENVAKSDLINVRLQAEKKYGKGTPAFEKFMQFYKSKKGI